jgi:hypothetical protein
MHTTKFWFIWQSGFRGEDFLEINQSAALPNEPKRGSKQLWKVLYGKCLFRFDPLTNMATIGNSCF